MIQASIADKNLVIAILEKALKDIPTMTAFSRTVNGKPHFKPLLEYAFHFSLARQSIYLSDDKTCVAFFNDAAANGGFLEKYYYLKFILFGLRWSKIRTISKHLKKIKQGKPKTQNYFHFWFLGTNNNNMKSNLSFIKELFALAKRENKAIYAETTVGKNEVVFNRFGLKTFEVIETPALNIRVSLMKIEPEELKI